MFVHFDPARILLLALLLTHPRKQRRDVLGKEMGTGRFDFLDFVDVTTNSPIYARQGSP